MAEGAGQRASDLARDAERAAVLLGDIDRLHLLAVIEPEQPFAGALDRDLLRHDLRPFEREGFADFGAEVLADVGHGADVRHAARIGAAPELALSHADLPLR